jgi:hypothetical protein
MLKRALKLKMRLQAFCENWKPDRKSKKKDDEPSDDEDDYDLSADKLSTEEWQGVEEVLQILRLLKRLSKRAERRETTLVDYVPTCDMIIGHLFKASQRFKSLRDTASNESEAEMYEWLHISAEAAWNKANTLYKKVDDSPAYYTALTMDARYKFEWFNQRWGSTPTKRDWLQGAKDVVRDHWQTFQSRHHSQDSNSTSLGPQNPQVPTQSLRDDDDDDDEFDTEEHLRISYHSRLQKLDEFEEYVATAPDPLHELPQWMIIETKHPGLVQFAADHIAIPASVSECERSFSSAKFALNPLRSRMKSDLFEALETLRSWYLSDLQEEQSTEKKRNEAEERQVIAQAFADAADEGESEESTC